MVKPLAFKGDSKKIRKRKHRDDEDHNRITDVDIASKLADNTQSFSKNKDGNSTADNATNATSTRQVATTTTASTVSGTLQPDSFDETAEQQEDQAWVSADTPSDINGPVMIVLPEIDALKSGRTGSFLTDEDSSSTTTITCLACDANGSVFASRIENLIDGDPSTAEPHDVRQVWVATKVPGNEGLSFKGHHGKYLSCDKYGILLASSSAISPFEIFNAIQSPSDHGHTGSGLFSFQTRGGDTETETFLTIKSTKTGGTSNKRAGSGGIVELRGDASAISFDTTVRVRMQARFKPRLRASKESKAREKISRRELEAAVGRRLQDDEVKRLKRARREGNFHEEVLNVRVRGKHDKFASF